MSEKVQPPIVRQAQWSVDQGAVYIAYPEPMTPEDVDDLEAFVAIWIRGCRRAALAAAAKAEAPSQDDGQ